MAEWARSAPSLFPSLSSSVSSSLSPPHPPPPPVMKYTLVMKYTRAWREQASRSSCSTEPPSPLLFPFHFCLPRCFPSVHPLQYILFSSLQSTETHARTRVICFLFCYACIARIAPADAKKKRKIALFFPHVFLFNHQQHYVYHIHHID